MVIVKDYGNGVVKRTWNNGKRSTSLQKCSYVFWLWTCRSTVCIFVRSQKCFLKIWIEIHLWHIRQSYVRRDTNGTWLRSLFCHWKCILWLGEQSWASDSTWGVLQIKWNNRNNSLFFISIIFFSFILNLYYPSSF